MRQRKNEKENKNKAGERIKMKIKLAERSVRGRMEQKND